MFTSITIAVESSTAKITETANSMPANAVTGGCQLHSVRPTSGKKIAANATINIPRGSTRAAIHPCRA